MALYDAVFIIRQDLTLENIDALADKLSAIITDHKGKVVSKEYWGLRSLAYKINKSSMGHYISLAIESENDGLDELKRVSGLNEDIVRDNIFKVEEHSKDPSKLAVSVNAKDYKAADASKKKDETVSESRREIDALIAKVNINV